MSLPENLPHQCNLYRATVRRDDEGSGDYEDVASSAYAAEEPCWVQPATAAEILRFQRRDHLVTHTVYFTRDPGFKLSDKLDVATGPYAGTRMTIRAFNEATAGIGVLWQAFCQNDIEA
jgi:hypothetical protein